MGTLAEMAVKIGADLSGLNKGIGTAKTSLAGLGKDTSTAAGSMNTAIAGTDAKMAGLGESATAAAGTVDTAAAGAKTELAGVGAAATTAADETKAGMEGAAAATEGAGVAAEVSKGMFGGLLASLGAMAVTLGLVEIGAQAFDFLKEQVMDILPAGEAAQQSQAALALAIRNAGANAPIAAEGANKLAESLSGVTTYSKLTIVSAETMMLHFQNIGTKVFPGAVKASLDLATAMHIGPEAAAKLLGKALDDPAKGIATLHRVGIDLTAQQQAMVKSMEKAGNTAGAQGIIMDALKSHYGGAAEAAGHTFAGQLAILHNKLDDVKENISQAVLPVLGQLATDAMPLVTTATNALTGMLTGLAGYATAQLIPTISNLAQNVIPPLVSGINQAANVAMPALTSAAHDIGTALGVVGSKISDVTSFFQHNKPIVDNVKVALLGMATLAIPPLIGALISAAVATWALVPPMLAAAAGAIVLAAPFIGMALAAGLVAIGIKALYDHFAPFHTAVDVTVTAVKAFAAAFMSDLKPAAADTLAFLQTGVADLQAIWQKAWPDIQAVFMGVWDVIQGVTQVAWSLVSGIIKVGMDVLHGHWGQAWKDIQAVFMGVWSGIQKILTGAWQIVSTIVRVGLTVLQAYWTNTWHAIQVFVPVAIGAVIAFLQHAWATVQSDAKSGFTGLLNYIGGLDIAMGNVVKQHIIQPITDRIHQLASDIVGLGGNVIQGLINGMNNSKQAVINALSGIVSSAVDAVKHLLGIHSPSQVFHEMGANVSLGMINGVKSLDVAGEVGKHLGVAPYQAAVSASASVSGGSSANGSNGGNGYQTATIQVYLDSRVLAQAVAQPLVNLIRLKTGAKV